MSRPGHMPPRLDLGSRDAGFPFALLDDSDVRVSGTQDPGAGTGRQSGSYWYDGREAGKVLLALQC